MFTYINHENELKNLFVHINSKAAYQKYEWIYTLHETKQEKKNTIKKPFYISWSSSNV